jgi:hypothetical protein
MFTFFNRVVGDRRSMPRHDLKIPVRFRVRNSTSEHSALSQNVSEMGVFFETTQPICAGTVLQLLLDMPSAISGEAGPPWLCTGHVVWSKAAESTEPSAGPKQGVGVQFDCFEVLTGKQFTSACTV